jgi:hypothetical protein
MKFPAIKCYGLIKIYKITGGGGGGDDDDDDDDEDDDEDMYVAGNAKEEFCLDS